MRPWVAFLYLCVCSWLTIQCQTADRLSFDVVSIKVAEAPGPSMGGFPRFGCSGGPGSSTPGTWRCRLVSLTDLIAGAYALRPYEFNAPDWMLRARFDIEARVPADVSKEQFRQIQQVLLQTRFKLQFHREQKQATVYELTIADNGLVMKETDPALTMQQEESGASPRLGRDGFPAFPPGRGGFIGINGRYRWATSNVSVSEIAAKLSDLLEGPVIDRTGLKGKYDIDLYWSQGPLGAPGLGAGDRSQPPEAINLDDAPTLERALQKRLGLKCIRKKDTIAVTVIDHAEKLPTEN